MNSLVDKLVQSYNTSINGTEVIIHPEYFNALKKVGQTRIMTNGIEILRNPEILKRLKSLGIEIISISYHMKIHNDISSVDKEKIKDVINIIKKNSMKVRIMVTINKKNYLYVEEMCKRAIELGANSIRFTNYLKTGNAVYLPNDYLTEKQILRFLEEIRRVRNLYDKNVLEIKRCGTFGIGNIDSHNNFKCPAGVDLIAVTPDMKVYPCNFLAKPGYEIGFVKDGNIFITKEINNSGVKCIAKEVFNQEGRFNEFFGIELTILCKI